MPFKLAPAGLALVPVILLACAGQRPPDHAQPRPVATAPARPPASADAPCEPLDPEVRRAAKAVLDAPAPGTTSAVRVPWDRRSTPRNLDRVVERLGLSETERAALFTHGFVVAERLDRGTYSDAFHDIYRSELPLYVSADAILHAIWKGHEHVLPHLERQLEPQLEDALAKLHTALDANAQDLSPEVARDVDLYLTVARSLFRPWDPVASHLHTDDLAKPILAAIEEASGMKPIELFGRLRVVDFSQYLPRGQYVRESLQEYFRAAMWLSRLEWNLVSRSGQSSAPAVDKSETPREATVALALARLASKTGVLDVLAPVEETWRVFAGRREDVSLRDLARLSDEARIQDLRDPVAASAKLRAAIGKGFRRTTNVHYAAGPMPELPVIATVLGPRIVADATALGQLVHPVVRDRHEVHAVDTAYLLGQDRAARYQRDDRLTYAALAPKLDEGRAILSARARSGDDLYSGWLRALVALSEPPAGTLPSFMTTPAFADFRLNTAIVGYGQLRHNHVLLAAETYDLAGCEMPDAFVEPAPALYDALAAYADRGVAAVARLSEDTRPYFENLALTMRVLAAISRAELAGEPLGREALRFLSMVVEYQSGDPYGGESKAKYNGWYLHLFFDPHQHGMSRGEPFETAGFIGDYFTSSDTKQVAYIGGMEPRLGVFVVDTGGGPRAVVGPVARGFERLESASHRLSDEESMQAPNTSGPWTASYTVAGRGRPRVVWTVEDDWVVAKAAEPLGRVAFEIADEHGATCSVARLVPREAPLRAKLEDVAGHPRASCHDLRVRLSDGTAWSLDRRGENFLEWNMLGDLWLTPEDVTAAAQEP